MKRILLVPIWISLWLLPLPDHYRTVSWARNEPGHRFELQAPVVRFINVRIYPGRIAIGRDSYAMDSMDGAVHLNDSLYAYQCRSRSGAKCAISIGKTYGESFKYRIIIIWTDSMYEYHAN